MHALHRVVGVGSHEKAVSFLHCTADVLQLDIIKQQWHHVGDLIHVMSRGAV